MSDEMAQALRSQGEVCGRMGSPLNAALLARAAGDLQDAGPVTALLAPWAEQPRQALLDAAVPLRLIGALHDLALSGEDAALAGAYAGQDEGALWTAARAAMGREAPRLAAFMAHEPQTNEVRRSICLAPGFFEVAKATGLPLRCFELGASAGLNLSWDRFAYDFGVARWGDPAAPVALDTDWQGPPPAVDAPVRVVERAACDRRPVNLDDPDGRRRLMAYLWADQPERLVRTRAAIEVALAAGVEVEAADAAEWTARRVEPAAGAATVLYHSIFWQYLPGATQAAIAATAADIGRRASAEAPFAWLRMEPAPGTLLTIEVTLTTWPGGVTRVLATVHPHGAWVRWTG